MTNQPQDYAIRQRCLDPTRSFSVRAPAGSGKTELLTQRVLVLLGQATRPEEILSITFTRKAAAEMLDRLLATLRWAATSPQPEAGYKQHSWQLAQRALQQDQQQGWHLLDNPGRLRIQTIDGLCARLTQSLPMQSGFGAQPETLNEAYPLYRQAVERLLLQIDDEDEVGEALRHLLVHLDNQVERISELLVSMLARRDQWLPLIGSGSGVTEAKTQLEAALSRLLNEELSVLKQQLEVYGYDLCLLCDYAASNLPADSKQTLLQAGLGMLELPAISAADLPYWQALRTLLLTDKNQWRKSFNVNMGFPPGSSKEEKAQSKARKDQLSALIDELKTLPGLEERLARIPLLPEDQYQPGQWALLENLTILLPHLVAHLLLSFNDQGAVDYTQVTQGALHALGDEEQPTELSLILDYQLRHILVDEFQDTSTPQIELLEKLTRGWETGDGRTLFIVGDGMQSCYGFRDANVGLFLDARQHGIGPVKMEAADLSVNFRSQQGIVDWVNQSFVSAFPAEDDISRGAVSYEASVAFNAALPEPAVSVDIYAGFEDRLAEAERVRELVASSLEQHPEQRVAILVRNRTHLKEILPALRRAGLQWQATDLDSLATRMWVVDLVSLLKAWLNPADRIAWLSVLRAPWCGLSNEDLLVIAGSARINRPIWQTLLELPMDELSRDGQQRLAFISQQFQSARAQRCRQSLRDEIEAIWLALKGPELLGSLAEYDDIQRLFALIEQHQVSGYIEDLGLFERDLANLYAAPASDADARIQVMTIHKSKGLEFETVILAGLDRRPRVNDPQLILWQQRINQQGQTDLLLSPLAPTGADPDPLYIFLQQEQQIKEQMEGTRLLYVGATRAINRLHIVSHLSADAKTAKPKAPSKQTLLASVWPFIEDQACIHQPKEPVAAPDTVAVLSQIKRIRDIPGVAPDHAGTVQLSEGANRPEPEWQETARHVGTLTHRILRQLVITPELYGKADDLCPFYPAWRIQLLNLGVPADEVSEAITRIDRLIKKTLGDPKGRWLLSAEHEQQGCEIPLTLSHGNKRVNLVVDRSFIDTDGTRWIIDYKTAEPQGEDLQTFMANEVELYRNQLQNYRSAYLRLEPERPIKTALYFPQIPQLVEVDG